MICWTACWLAKMGRLLLLMRQALFWPAPWIWQHMRWQVRIWPWRKSIPLKMPSWPNWSNSEPARHKCIKEKRIKKLFKSWVTSILQVIWTSSMETWTGSFTSLLRKRTSLAVSIKASVIPSLFWSAWSSSPFWPHPSWPVWLPGLLRGWAWPLKICSKAN